MGKYLPYIRPSDEDAKTVHVQKSQRQIQRIYFDRFARDRLVWYTDYRIRSYDFEIDAAQIRVFCNRFIPNFLRLRLVRQFCERFAAILSQSHWILTGLYAHTDNTDRFVVNRGPSPIGLRDVA